MVHLSNLGTLVDYTQSIYNQCARISLKVGTLDLRYHGPHVPLMPSEAVMATAAEGHVVFYVDPDPHGVGGECVTRVRVSILGYLVV